MSRVRIVYSVCLWFLFFVCGVNNKLILSTGVDLSYQALSFMSTVSFPSLLQVSHYTCWPRKIRMVRIDIRTFDFH